MNILCITHADFEAPGAIIPWAQDEGHKLTVCRPYRGETLPTIEDFDALFIMGGPQSPRDCEHCPYLSNEITLIGVALQLKKIILGVCLGAQLIGEALGAAVEQSPEREIGIFPLELTEAGQEDPLLMDFPHCFPVTHWHNDMTGLPEGATVLASSEGCPRQIVRYRTGVYGFQCHFELTRKGIQMLINADPQEPKQHRFVQTPDAMLSADYVPITAHMRTLLNRLMALKLSARPTPL